MIVIALALLASVAWAGQSYKRVRYWAYLHGITNDTSAIVVDSQLGVVEGWMPEWGPKPTDVDLAGITEEQATEWHRRLPSAPRYEASGIEVPYIVTISQTNEQRWSEGVLDDGTPYRWKSGNSPWDQGTSSSNEVAARSRAKTNAVDLKQLRLDIATTIDGLQTDVDQTVFTGAQRTEFNDLRKLCIDLAQEVRRLRKAVAQAEN